MTAIAPTVDEHAAREEARAWLAREWHPPIPRSEWLARVVDAGWAVPSWPTTWYGREWSTATALAVEDEFKRVGAEGAGQDRINLWANTVLAFGSDDMKRRFIRPLLLDEVRMCLLYSEPGAGSDLAGLQTRADRDGDEWVVNGQKVWTSGAAKADFGMLIARTNWDVPKHRGISFFFFPMKQPGVEVRPLKQVTGESHFNEVFITDGRVPDANRLGDAGQGWRVLQTALMYERSFMGERSRGPDANTAPKGDGAPEEPMNTNEVDLVVLARDTGRRDEALIRQEVSEVTALRMVNQWNAQRAKAELQQGSSSPVASLGKLAMSTILHRGAAVQTDIVGAEAMLDGPDWPRAKAANFMSLNAFFTSIGGGTDQIQRNIIGERLLGLPREPELDKDVPFREVRKAIDPRQ
jgi:alkylation response protein AidB-like acyl-CoA dehydrogenase